MEHEYFEALYPPSTRAEELTLLASCIQKGSSCQVIGLPGVGRSAFLGLLAYNRAIRNTYLANKETKAHAVVITFSEIKKRSLLDVMKFLFLNLTESLRERKMTQEHTVVGNIFREHLQFHDELVLFQGLKEAIDYLALDRHLQVVFLFDRFEEYVPTVTAEFFSNLRILRSRAKYHFSVVFSVNRPLESLLEPALLADYYEFIVDNHLYLRLFDKVSTDFRLSYIEKVTRKKLSVEQRKEILALTGGVGRLIKLSAEALLAEKNASTDLATFLLQKPTIKAALSSIWFSLTPSEQAFLREGHFEKSDSYLSAVGLIVNGKITIPLFADFLKAEYTKKQPQAIIYDENTNEIRRGTDLLSDQLTASEFRLLRYLVQHQEKIVEREELISVVWQGMKSTMGITDQAIDQLIFRLRRKIEEDANTPHHILTVKGRGFKFAS